jgi:hypothetical protein
LNETLSVDISHDPSYTDATIDFDVSPAPGASDTDTPAANNTESSKSRGETDNSNKEEIEGWLLPLYNLVTSHADAVRPWPWAGPDTPLSKSMWNLAGVVNPENVNDYAATISELLARQPEEDAEKEENGIEQTDTEKAQPDNKVKEELINPNQAKKVETKANQKIKTKADKEHINQQPANSPQPTHEIKTANHASTKTSQPERPKQAATKPVRPVTHAASYIPAKIDTPISHQIFQETPRPTEAEPKLISNLAASTQEIHNPSTPQGSPTVADEHVSDEFNRYVVPILVAHASEIANRDLADVVEDNFDTPIPFQDFTAETDKIPQELLFTDGETPLDSFIAIETDQLYPIMTQATSLELDEPVRLETPLSELAHIALDHDENVVNLYANASEQNIEPAYNPIEQSPQKPIQAVGLEPVVAQLAEQIQAAETEITKTANEILDKIRELPARLEEQAANGLTQEQIQDEIEVLFTELLDELGIEFTPELIEALARAAIALKPANKNQNPKTENTEEQPSDPGTHEIKQLLSGLNSTDNSWEKVWALGRYALWNYRTKLAA